MHESKKAARALNVSAPRRRQLCLKRRIGLNGSGRIVHLVVVHVDRMNLHCSLTGRGGGARGGGGFVIDLRPLFVRHLYRMYYVNGHIFCLRRRPLKPPARPAPLASRGWGGWGSASSLAFARSFNVLLSETYLRSHSTLFPFLPASFRSHMSHVTPAHSTPARTPN